MWRLWNFLFGWHYVALRYGSSDYICRVRVDGDGEPYADCYGEIIHLKDPTANSWTPLTFRREELTRA